MGFVYGTIAWFILAGLVMMLTRRSWWEWDPSEPRPKPAPIQRPALTPDRLARAMHAHDEEVTEHHDAR
jgi:hypothetical protein